MGIKKHVCAELAESVLGIKDSRLSTIAISKQYFLERTKHDTLIIPKLCVSCGHEYFSKNPSNHYCQGRVSCIKMTVRKRLSEILHYFNEIYFLLTAN